MRLMEWRIKKILMICSSYDAYILEEDGLIDAQLSKEYVELNISNPPSFTWATHANQARALLEEGGQFDLIICMMNAADEEVFDFAAWLRARSYSLPLVLLTNYSREFQKSLERHDCSAIDFIFSWHGNADLILAIIKLIEDRMNAEKDVFESGVQSILLVEDSIRYYSTYLPAVYKLVLKQSAEFLRETLSEQQQKVCKRARPKLFLATNYDDAVMLYNKYKKNLLGVISDVGFVLHKGDPSAMEKLDAGLDLCQLIKQDDPYMPILLQSSQESIRPEAQALGVGFVVKNSKTLLIELSEYISEEFAFGDFVVKSEDDGEVLARAKNLQELQVLIKEIPDDALLRLTARNRLSKWLYSRGLFMIAGNIKNVRSSDFASTALLRTYIIGLIKDFLILNGQGVIAKFDPATYSRYIQFARMGDGSLGGKARGLAFLNRLLQQHHLGDKFPGLRISIPQTLVIATDYFDDFIVENGLKYVVNTEGISDEDILSEFISSRLPEVVVNYLKVFINKVNTPLAVRSSSKLEDSIFQPFSGIYATYMIPLTENKDQMLRLLTKAIKSVYASVYYAASRNYIQTTANMLSEEKMGIVIQSIVGTEDSGYFFPTFSGVARSVNYYPLGHEKPEDGIVNMAFGLGKLVVEGGRSLRFSPKYPKNVLQTSDVAQTLSQTQNVMYAMSTRPEAFKTSINDGVNIACFPMEKAQTFRNLRYVASTWDMENERMVPGAAAKGRKCVTFANILQNDVIPLAAAISALLDICVREMRGQVEIEFAVNMDVSYGRDARFYLLQVRPITQYAQSPEFNWDQVDVGDLLLASSKALGSGVIAGVRDVVYVRSSAFDKSRTRDIAAEVEQLNRTMKAQGQTYVLVGPGRWGSSDPWLGIPIVWNNISEARVIVESGMPDFQVDPSEGTHFFQNVTSLGVGYLTINAFRGEGLYNEAKLNALPAWYESQFVRAVHFEDDLVICADGRSNRAVVACSPKEKAPKN